MTTSKALYTLGHSTRSIEDFLALLQSHGIEKVVDIRTIPRSGYNPQFNQSSLRASLRKVRIGYVHLKQLGGLRHPRKDSINTGWKNASFRGYADYMQTPPFWRGIARLEKIASQHKTVILCAEAVPWRCHRSLVADAFTIRKWKVYHIQSRITARLHKKTPFLKVRKGMLIYPG